MWGQCQATNSCLPLEGLEVCQTLVDDWIQAFTMILSIARRPLRRDDRLGTEAATSIAKCNPSSLMLLKTINKGLEETVHVLRRTNKRLLMLINWFVMNLASALNANLRPIAPSLPLKANQEVFLVKCRFR